MSEATIEKCASILSPQYYLLYDSHADQLRSKMNKLLFGMVSQSALLRYGLDFIAIVGKVVAWLLWHGFCGMDSIQGRFEYI